MRLAGTGAFLALWNGIRDPELQAEYEAWHALEHVPERVGTPGFAWACRYAALPGAVGQPAYFTFYALESLAALQGPRYQELLDHPTDWSRRMRTVLTDFCREPCELLSSHGVSTAACLAALRVRVQSPAGVQEILERLARSGSAVHACWGRVDARSGHPLSPGVPAHTAGTGFDAVVLLQHIRADALRAAAGELQAALGQAASPRAPASFYELQSCVHQLDLPHPLAMRQPPRPDLQQRFMQGDLTR